MGKHKVRVKRHGRMSGWMKQLNFHINNVKITLPNLTMTGWFGFRTFVGEVVLLPIYAECLFSLQITRAGILLSQKVRVCFDAR